MKHSLTKASNQIPDSISDSDFAAIVRITLEVSGISIDDSKRPMIYSRFSRRLRELKLNSFADYINILKKGDSDEYRAFINTVTTNLTYFYREPHHFDYLNSVAIPALVKRNEQKKEIRLWSSACSSGQEAYSMAMVLADHAQLRNWNKKILATDIDTDMVRTCTQGIYSTEALRGLEPETQKNWLDPADDGFWQVKSELRRMLVAKHLNLFSTWPFRSDVDVIFCRNALIYFDETHQLQLLQKFADFQTPGAFLFLGHSESIKSSSIPYKRVSNTVYERY